ncbi:MAG: pullulanase [FCB group bacterium]|nr:pullulanase [FCB group bacterium]
MISFITQTILAGSNLPYGAEVKEGATYFKIKAPRAQKVELIIFENFDDSMGEVVEMGKGKNQVFHMRIDSDLTGNYYGYRIFNSDPKASEFPPQTIIADLWSKAVATQNIYNPISKTLIISSDYDWEKDGWLQYDPRDLVIYEAHLKDMTAHPSSSAKGAGYYDRFQEINQNGGIAHLKDMGYNAVEFLPLFDFANVEIPFRDSSIAVYNTWNPYETNHWGYMTTFFFAPESQYASDGTNVRNEWIGYKGRQIDEFKDMVKTLHANGIAVILDVVYNHVSQYGYQPLKQVSKTDYFRKNKEGGFSSVSGCGNDLKTENPDMRNLIIESIKYWMQEYHIDGFRFDLGLLIDFKTMSEIRTEARKLNPNVFLTCEPWGGGYDPAGFSDLGWSSWNDQIRNGVKGENPHSDTGFVFGNWQGNLSRETFKRFFAGSPRAMGGQYVSVDHSVNYLESHDNHTLGDFVRIALGKVADDDVVDLDKLNEHVALTEEELKIHKLAALALLTSQGPIMIAQGQEWARAKVIHPTEYPDTEIGKIDHNSYNKDNETNYLNWEHKDINSELVDYYRGLISLRQDYPALRRTDQKGISFIKGKKVEYSFGYRLKPAEGTELLVLLNGDRKKTEQFKLPEGAWQIICDENQSDIQPADVQKTSITLNPSTGMILRKK